MDDKIKIAIVGYGNIGKGVELAIKKNPDMALEAILTRRNSGDLITKAPRDRIYHVAEAQHMDNIDVAILCGGSATDLPEQGPYFASLFNTVDSYDTHAKIPSYFWHVNEAARDAGTTSIISTGWDPGLFSLLRVIEEAALPGGQGYTFWGTGVSQGHSDAIRRIDGVKDARQYTIPIEDAVARVRSGENPELTTREKHLRDCYVVAEDGIDKKRIETEIQTMPNYFSDYDTKVSFISQQEMDDNHSGMPHGGFVLRSGNTSPQHKQLIEFSLKLDSNPEFTGNILVAYARAAYRMNKEGLIGAKTVLDIAPAYLSIRSNDELRKEML